MTLAKAVCVKIKTKETNFVHTRPDMRLTRPLSVVKFPLEQVFLSFFTYVARFQSKQMPVAWLYSIFNHNVD